MSRAFRIKLLVYFESLAFLVCWFSTSLLPGFSISLFRSHHIQLSGTLVFLSAKVTESARAHRGNKARLVTDNVKM